MRKFTTYRCYLSLFTVFFLIVGGHAALAGTVWLLRTDPELYSTMNGEESAVIINQGITAQVRTSGGTFTRTFNGVGVDGPGKDDRDGIDKDEWIGFIFDQDLYLTAYSVSSWSKKYGDSGVFELGGIPQIMITKSGYHRVNPLLIPAGQELVIRGTGGKEIAEPNGWSFTSFTTEPVSSTNDK